MAYLTLTRRSEAGNWYARGTIFPRTSKSQRVFESLHTVSKTEALNRLARLEYKLLHSQPEEQSDLLFKDAVRVYQEKRGNADSKKDLSAYRLMLPRLGEVPLDMLDTEALEKYVAERHENSKPNTIERDLTRVRAIVRYAAKKGLVSSAKVADNLASLSDLVDEYDDARMRWLDQGNRDLLINWFKFDAELHLVMHILMLSGLRLGECLRLGPHDFTSAGIQTWSIKGKGRKKRHRIVPLHPRIRRLLPFYPLRSAEQMFQLSETTFRRYFNEGCERLGIDDFRIHDCRHTYAVHLRLAGADIDEIAKLLGHTNIDTASRYASIVPARVSALTGRL